MPKSAATTFAAILAVTVACSSSSNVVSRCEGDADCGGSGGSAAVAGTGGAQGSGTGGAQGGGTGGTQGGGTAGVSGAAGSTDGGPDGSSGCTSNAECSDQQQPYCVQGACRPCTDARIACASLDATQPICRPETGRCAPCADHTECATGACRISTGACFPADNRLWVSSAANCAAATGSQQAPFCTIGEALNAVVSQPGSEPWAVFVAGSAATYALPSDAGLPERPFALIGPERGLSARLAGSPPSQLRSFGTGDRYLARVTLGEPGAEGTVLDCAGTGELWVSDAVIDNGARGIRVGCDLRLRRTLVSEAQGYGAEVEEYGRLTAHETEFRSNSGGLRTEGITVLERSSVVHSYLQGGISVPAGTLSMDNCVMLSNVYAIGHIDLGVTAAATLTYVVALGDAVSCGGASSSLAIRNSIVDNITCTGQVSVQRSLVAPGSVSLGSGNVAVTTDDYPLIFVNYPQGNVHVRPDPPAYLLGIATRSATDLAVDFDGDPRPAVGRPDYPGIDAAPP